MSLKDFSERWNAMSAFKSKSLVSCEIVQTQLPFFAKTPNKPGFLTPWLSDAGFVEAIEELLAKAIFNGTLVFSSLASIFTMPYQACFGDDENEVDFGMWCASVVGTPYYAVAFVCDLALNLLSMVTRTLATLVYGVASMLSECCASDEQNDLGLS